MTEGLTFSNDKFTNGVIKTARCGTKETDLSIIKEIKENCHH